MKKRLALKKLTIRDLDESSLINVVGSKRGQNARPDHPGTVTLAIASATTGSWEHDRQLYLVGR
jgi:hypothetical protein